MSDDQPNNRGEGPSNNNRRNQEPQFNWKGFLLFAVAATLIGGAVMSPNLRNNSERLSYGQFKELVEQGRVVNNGDDQYGLKLVRETTGKEYISGHYVKGSGASGSRNERREEDPVATRGSDPGAGDAVAGGMIQPGKNTVYKKEDLVSFRTTANFEFDRERLGQLLEKNGVLYSHTVEENMWGSLLVTFLPLLLIMALVYFLIRQQLKTAGRGAMSFGKSRARLLSQDRNKITFKDVAGVEEAKDEVQELVEFLKDPKRFQRLGGKIPKGVLMVGPPGTGKTLLAKAIAGEADVPFFSISGSDFVEMFVGVGASRVRDMFEQGKKNAPCLIFIDEIDAVGRHRGHGLGGGHDEREQTLNALLVEMDGFDTQEGIIIIAATNRPDVLDPALLRPGRFDRQVTVSLPDVRGREEILRVHAKKVKLAENAELSKIARGTPGFSGAELANLINEAALLAARRNLKSIGTPELEEARDKVRWGRERRSLALSEKEKENTAYHEAGHAILIEVLEHTDPLHKVTIIPRGPSLGSTMWLPEEDKFTHRKSELLDDLVVAMGGRVAEEIQFGDVTNGAMGDIRMATAVARSMVCAYGMSDKMGMVDYGDGEAAVFLARDLGGKRNYSQATAQKIDEEVKLFIDAAYDKAKSILLSYKDKLDAIAAALLEYETLDGPQIKEIMQHGRMLNPPAPPPKPPAPPPIPAAPGPRATREEDEDEGGLAPGIVGAPA